MSEYVDAVSCASYVEDLCVMCRGSGLGSATTGLVAQAEEICKIKKLLGWKSNDECKHAYFNFKQIHSKIDTVKK